MQQEVRAVTPSPRSLARYGCVIALVTAALTPGASAQAPDTIRGTITTDSGVPIAAAQVTVTRAPDRAYLATQTNQLGEYQIVFDSGTGDYLVHVVATGYVTARRRVIRAAAERTLTADFKMKSSVQTLEKVSVVASRPKPSRGTESGHATEVGEAAVVASGVYGALSPDQEGDLTAIAGTLSGVSLTPFGASVMGLGPAQNSVTLGSMAFPGAEIPRDASISVKSSTSTYDPSRGWFSGMQTNVDLGHGGPFSARPSHLTLDAPPLQYADPIASSLGQRFTGLQLSTGGSGIFDLDRFEYNFGAQASHRFSDAVSLMDAKPDVLENAGVSADSAARFRTILSGFGFPEALARSRLQVTDDASIIARFDHKPFDYTTFKEPKQTWAVIGYAKLARSTNVGMQPISTPTHSGESSQAIGSVQGLYSAYVGSSYLTEFRTGFSVTTKSTSPNVRVPEGRVRLTSDFPDTTSALASILFGGATGQDSRLSNWTWETTNQTQFYIAGRPKHRVNLSGDARLDGVSNRSFPNSSGSFFFNSLNDLAANLPSSYTRRLASPASHASEWNGYAAIGDLFTVNPAFRLLYGIRLEGNRFLTRPADNPSIETLFHVRTDAVPNTVHLSPRLGFTWSLRGGGARDIPNRMMINRLGQFIFPGSGYIRGGIGEFRDFLQPTLVSSVLNSTGLPDGTRDLACYGPDAPPPDWVGYASGAASAPAQCLTGGTSAIFSDTARRVRVFDRSYTASRSWRGNLSYSSNFKRLVYSIDGSYSLNLNQSSLNDLNLTRAPRFFLGSEGRPVFVGPGSIVTSSGAVSPVEARVQNGYSNVFSNLSDLHAYSRRLTIGVTPTLNTGFVSLNYTLGSARAQSRGFDGTTFGAPWLIDWARSDLDVRHQFQMQAGYPIRKLVFTAYARVQSGFPFTPVVSSDVNGDGLANDRAFIFDPSLASSGPIGAATRSLIESAPTRVRRCLASQVGQAAGRNSCEGPWNVSVNGRIGFTKKVPGSDKVANVGIVLTNPLAGLDQLLHGSAKLRGWGSSAQPDPVLYSVRGFDPATNNFTYEINPRFGSASPANSVFRAPFRVTLDVSINLGSSLSEQQLHRWLQPGRGGHPGKKLTAAELKTRYARGVPDPYALLINETDSLLLDKSQVRALQQADTAYLQKMDSVWGGLADYLANLGDRIDVRDAVKRQESATDAAWEIARLDVHATLGKILNPVQLRMLPWPSGLLYQAKAPVHIRFFMAG